MTQLPGNMVLGVAEQERMAAVDPRDAYRSVLGPYKSPGLTSSPDVEAQYMDDGMEDPGFNDQEVEMSPPKPAVSPYAEREISKTRDERTKAHLSGRYDQKQLEGIDEQTRQRIETLQNTGAVDKQPENELADMRAAQIHMTPDGREEQLDAATGQFADSPGQVQRDTQQAVRRQRQEAVEDKLADQRAALATTLITATNAEGGSTHKLDDIPDLVKKLLPDATEQLRTGDYPRFGADLDDERTPAQKKVERRNKQALAWQAEYEGVQREISDVWDSPGAYDRNGKPTKKALAYVEGLNKKVAFAKKFRSDRWDDEDARDAKALSFRKTQDAEEGRFKRGLDASEDKFKRSQKAINDRSKLAREQGLTDDEADRERAAADKAEAAKKAKRAAKKKRYRDYRTARFNHYMDVENKDAKGGESKYRSRSKAGIEADKDLAALQLTDFKSIRDWTEDDAKDLFHYMKAHPESLEDEKNKAMLDKVSAFLLGVEE